MHYSDVLFTKQLFETTLIKFTRHILCICTMYQYQISVADTSMSFTLYQNSKGNL